MTPGDLVAVIAADPGGSGLVLDFDGTLAPIVDDPTASGMSQVARRALGTLPPLLAVVAIVSGRPAGFLGERAAVDNVRLLGMYGTEEWRDGEAVARPETTEWIPALNAARERLAKALQGHPGVVLEDKGLAVALHWRTADDLAAAEQFVVALADQVARDTGLAQEPGKFVVELRPPSGWDKGSAVDALHKELGLRQVVYIGDDLGDLPGLRAARRASGVAVVVDHGVETPAVLRDEADVVLDGVGAVEDFLVDLAFALTSGNV